MSSKSKALSLFGNTGRLLTAAERRAKAKLLNFPKSEKGSAHGMKEQMHRHKENIEHQRTTGRAWND